MILPWTYKARPKHQNMLTWYYMLHWKTLVNISIVTHILMSCSIESSSHQRIGNIYLRRDTFPKPHFTIYSREFSSHQRKTKSAKGETPFIQIYQKSELQAKVMSAFIHVYHLIVSTCKKISTRNQSILIHVYHMTLLHLKVWVTWKP